MSEYLIIAGLSGAGRSTAADTFEDLGWFVIDNMPPSLLPKVTELTSAPASEVERVALVIGRSGSERFDEDLLPAIEELKSKKNRVSTVFLDASDDVLLRRFDGTRRRHPMAGETVLDGIVAERALMETIRDYADLVVDTSELNVHELRARLLEIFEKGSSGAPMQIQVISFGFKYGVPVDVDMALDVRFLPNPHWIDDLRPLTGLDAPVRDYVLGQQSCGEFVARLSDLLEFLLPHYAAEGKTYLTIGIGCTGGRHRSVVLAEEVARLSSAAGYPPVVHHRDVER